MPSCLLTGPEMGDCPLGTGAFVPDGIEPASRLDQRLQSPIAELLRESAALFRKHPLYDSCGDGFYLTAQAKDCEAAADIIDALCDAAQFARSYFANIPANRRLSEQQKALNLLADALARAGDDR